MCDANVNLSVVQLFTAVERVDTADKKFEGNISSNLISGRKPAAVSSSGEILLEQLQLTVSSYRY